MLANQVQDVARTPKANIPDTKRILCSLKPLHDLHGLKIHTTSFNLRSHLGVKSFAITLGTHGVQFLPKGNN